MYTTKYKCKICGNTEHNSVVVAREMMCGFRDEFTYFKCSFCGCLQITDPPKDLSRYYPSETYYAHSRVVALPNSKKVKLKYFFKRILFDTYWYLKLPLLNLPCFRYFNWLKTLQKIAKTTAILDVGCGNGHLLQKMSIVGFKNLTGIDPFIEKDILYQSGVKILKTDVYGLLNSDSIANGTVNQTFELIMLHHSFEHIDNPRETLNQLYKLLSPEGQLLIRIPVSDSFAWRKYGINWFQLDAPRHFFLHTTKSIALLAKDCGFVLKRIIYDSTAQQFLNSEKYCRDLFLLQTDIEISAAYIRQCKKQAACLNKIKDGDQACFVLKKNIQN
jgi:2-polyprenyl-3-methyl-5-hydroxy-6-metoxy-1,4-benzoquinol methylase